MGLYKAALQNGREYGGNGSGVYGESGKGEEGVTQGGNAGVMHDTRRREKAASSFRSEISHEQQKMPQRKDYRVSLLFYMMPQDGT